MTIPVAPVQIHPQYVQTPQTSPGLEMLMTALEHRRQLGMEQKKLDLELQSFELHKKIAGSQLAGNELDNAKKQREFKEHQLDLDARAEALGIVNGHLDVLRDPKAWGAVWARIKDPRVAGFVQQYRDTQLESGQKAANLTSTETANTSEQTTRDILTRYGPKLTTDVGQRQAIAEVIQAAGPEAGQKLASALNSGSGRYGHVVGPDGFLYITDSKNGTVRRDTTVGQRGQPTQEAIRRGAETIVELLDAQQEVVKSGGLGASKNPIPAATLEGSKVLGVPLSAFSNLFRSDPQQATQMLRTRFVHNYIGLLPHTRSSQALLENLAQSYWPAPGSGAAVLRRAERDRTRLRAVMQGVATGKITDLTRLPGFAEAAAAAASEGANVPQGGTVSPQDFLNPIR